MKSGFVVIVGRSNVGKSTLLNTLVGTKIAAVSVKPQMTRHIIHGVMNREEGQAVFVDTPGIFKAKKSLLSAKLYEKAHEALQDVDLIIYVVDPTREIGPEERAVKAMVDKAKAQKILVINKCDLPEADRNFSRDYEFWGPDFAGVFGLSAIKARHIEPLKQKVMELLPEGEKMYPDDQLTNIDSGFWVAEIIREKIFSVLDKEVPYNISVEIDEMNSKKFGKDQVEGLEIKGRILTVDERYKKIIIGYGGKKIKEIGQMARRELEAATNRKVFLELEVETDSHWIERV